MAITVGQLQYIITGDDSQLKGTLSRSETAFRAFSGSLISGGAALVGIFGGISAGIAKLVSDASQLQEVFVHVASNTAMSNAQFEQMRSTVLQLGATSNKSFADIADGYMRVTNHGYEGAAATQVLVTALRAATATGAEAAQTANALAVVMHDFHAPASEAAHIMDALTIASAKGNLTLQQFVDSSGKMISTASGLKVPLADVLAAMSSLTSTGRTAAAASTEVTAAMVKIANPTKAAREEMERLKKTGVDITSDFGAFALQSKGLGGIIEDLKNKLGGHTDEVLKLIAAQRGGLAMMALVSTSYDDFKQRLDLVNQALRGELTPTMDGYNRATQTMAFQVEQFSNRMQLLGVTLQTAIGGQFVSTLEKASDGLLKLIGFLQNIPPAAITAGIAFTTAAAAVGAASVVVGGMVALMGGPLTLAVVGLGIDIGILAAAVATNFGHIREAFGQFFSGGTASLKGVAFAIGALADGMSIVGRIVVTVVDVMLTALNALGKSFLATVGIAKGFGEVIAGIGTMDVGRVAAGIDQIRTAVEKEGEALRNVFSGLASREFARINESIENFHGKWANALSGAVDKAGSFASNVKNFAGGVAGQLANLSNLSQKHFGDVGDAAENAAKRHKQAKDVVYAAVQDWLKATSQLEISKTVWDKLSESVKTSLKSNADQYHKDIDALQTWRANLLALVLNLGFEVEKATNGLGFSFKKLSDTIVVESTKLSTSISGVTEGVGPMFENLQQRSAEATALLVSDSQKRVARYNEEQAALAKGHDALMLAFDELTHSIPSAWNQLIDGILLGSGKVGDELVKLGVTIKGWANDVFQVFRNLPGEWGKATQSIFKTIDQWANFLNSILGLLHRFSSAIPSTLSDLISSIFKSSQSVISSSVITTEKGFEQFFQTGNKATTGLSNAIGKMSDNAKIGFAAAGGAAAAFGTALATVQAGGSKAMAILSGTISSAIAGITAAMAFTGPVGAIVGGISMVGTLLGALFGGKSAAQKEKERLDNEKLKADIAASAQATMNAALEGFQKALAFLDTLDQFTAPRKAKFQEFWKAMSRLMDNFVVLAKKWQGENLEKDKAIAEAVGAVADGLARVPAAFDAINSSFTLPQSSFDIFFSNLDKFMEMFFARSEVWVVGVSKRAKKVADRLASVVDLITPFTEGIKSMVDLKMPTDEAFGILDKSLESIVTHIGNLADKFDKGYLKTMAFFAEKAQAGLALWKDAIDAIKATVDVPMVSPDAVDNITGSIEIFVNKLISAAEMMTTEGLAKAAAIANATLPISAAIKAWAEAAALIKDYSGVAAETWDKILADFNRAIALMNLMLASAIDFIPDAIKFEETMKTIADHLKAGLDLLGSGLVAAASAFGGVVNAIQGGVPIGSNPAGGGVIGGEGGSFAGASFGGGSFAPAFAGGASNPPSSGGEIHVHVHAGMFVHESHLGDLVVKGLTAAQGQSRLRLKVV